MTTDRHSRLRIWLRFSLALLLIPHVSSGDKDLSDAEKKEIVYRMYRDYKAKDFPEIVDISPQDAMELLPSGSIVFVDARKREEMEVSMLPHAISEEEFLQDTGKYKEKIVVAYCTISYRSGILVKELAGRGVAIYNLKGGLLAWVLEGGKVYDAGGETKRVHVYGKKWNYAPSGYETVTFGFFERLF